MKLERFAYFLAVAQTGSITLGAQKSFITQTAMSQQMAALEAELGLPLLKRSKSGTSLTEAGQALVPMAEQLVQCYQAIETFADAQRRQPRTLTIAYTGPMEQQLLLRAIPAFRAHHPEVELRVRQLSMARLRHCAGDSGRNPLAADEARHGDGAPHLRRRRVIAPAGGEKFRHPAGADAFSRHPPAGGRESQGEQPNRPLADWAWVDKGRAALCGHHRGSAADDQPESGHFVHAAGQLSRRHPPDSHRQRHADSPPHRGGHAPDDAAAPAIRRAASSGGHGGAASISSAYDEKENACLTFLSQSSMIQA